MPWLQPQPVFSPAVLSALERFGRVGARPALPLRLLGGCDGQGLFSLYGAEASPTHHGHIVYVAWYVVCSVGRGEVRQSGFQAFENSDAMFEMLEAITKPVRAVRIDVVCPPLPTRPVTTPPDGAGSRPPPS
jgi:hypothetical protein